MKRIIALDGDGVLLDYNAAYAHAWQRAFGELPVLVNPQAYWPRDRWSVTTLSGAALEKFRAAFDEDFWRTVPAVPGAVQACDMLDRLGYELVCVTALDARFAAARLHNLQSLGFAVARVLTTGHSAVGRSPKAQVLGSLQPAAFVDDFAPYLVGVADSIHLALIMRDADGSPNSGELAHEPDSRHTDLLAFARWWGGSVAHARAAGGRTL